MKPQKLTIAARPTTGPSTPTSAEAAEGAPAAPLSELAAPGAAAAAPGGESTDRSCAAAAILEPALIR